MCDGVRWVWQGGMGYAHTTAEQPCHDIYMMNWYAPCMLHDGSIMGATHAGGGEGLGGPPGLPLKVQGQGPSDACAGGHFGTPRITCASAGGRLSRLSKVGRWSGSGWVGIGQGGEAYLRQGRHRTLSRSYSWQLWVRSHQRATWHLCPCSCTFASLLLALGVARGWSWLGPGAMGTAARRVAGARAALERRAPKSITIVIDCNRFYYKARKPPPTMTA